MKLSIGQSVKTKVDQSGYTPYHNIAIPQGSTGIVGAVCVPCVRLRPGCKCQTFTCVDFLINGKKIRASYHKHELITITENDDEKRMRLAGFSATLSKSIINKIVDLGLLKLENRRARK